jgi:hypothetical protein
MDVLWFSQNFMSTVAVSEDMLFVKAVFPFEKLFKHALLKKEAMS